MGFNKRYINKEKISSAFKQGGAKGVTDLYKVEAVIIPPDSNVCDYIGKINNMSVSIKHKHELIDIYMYQLLEGLYEYK
jgi:hypothetical protein